MFVPLLDQDWTNRTKDLDKIISDPWLTSSKLIASFLIFDVTRFLGAAYGTAQEPVEIPCKGIPNISGKQVRFCLKNQDKMPTVAEGAYHGIEECQFQFRGRRWNCTTIDGDQSVFGRVLDRGKWTDTFDGIAFFLTPTHTKYNHNPPPPQEYEI